MIGGVFLCALVTVPRFLSGQSPQSRDSAGIVIIEHGSSRAEPGLRLQVDDRLSLQIGVQSGDRNYQFARIVAATRLRDGSIVIADRTPGEIRIFDTNGRFVRKVGRVGQGPGEFSALQDVRALEGDSLIAWDANSSRLTAFTPTGEAARTFVPLGDPAAPTALPGLVRGALRDGSMFAARVVRTPPPPVRAAVRDTLFVNLHTRDGQFIRPVTRVLGLETLQRTGGSMTLPDGRKVPAFSVTGVPFARETLMRAGPDWLYVGRSERYEIECYDRTGVLKRIIRVRQSPRPVTASMISAHRKAPRFRDSPSRPNVSPTIDDAFYPKTLPPYAVFRVDDAGRLWVQDYPAPGEQPRWSVFDQDGRLVANVLTPAGVEVLEVGSTYLIGLWRDEDEVEYVRVYGVKRG
jgi:hypothetical protein